MRSLKLGIVCAILAQTCLAIIVHETATYKRPIKKIAGRVLGFGPVNPGVIVQVFDKPEVWSDKSLGFEAGRRKQSIVASATTGPNGRFGFRGIPKGSYEVQFSPPRGWNLLSVFVSVDPAAYSDRLCVELGREGAGDESSAEACAH
jgi:hypothetical protein